MGKRRHRAGVSGGAARSISPLDNGNGERLAVIAGNRIRNAALVAGTRTQGYRRRGARRLNHVGVVHALLRTKRSGLATREIGIDAKAVRENAHDIHDGSALHVSQSQVGGPVRCEGSLVRQREDKHDQMEAFGGCLASGNRAGGSKIRPLALRLRDTAGYQRDPQRQDRDNNDLCPESIHRTTPDALADAPRGRLIAEIRSSACVQVVHMSRTGCPHVTYRLSTSHAGISRSISRRGGCPDLASMRYSTATSRTCTAADPESRGYAPHDQGVGSPLWLPESCGVPVDHPQFRPEGSWPASSRSPTSASGARIRHASATSSARRSTPTSVNRSITSGQPS